jgi:hypothetical protein
MSASILILAHATDSGADSVAACLTHRLGQQAVRLVRPELLSLASWSHRVDAHGRATSRLTWPRTDSIDDAGVIAVLNRIRYLPVPRFHRASAKDREYASSELQALVASWLAQFGPRLVHEVRRHAIVTAVLPLQQWAAAAASCGLPVATRTFSTSPRAPRLHSPVPIESGSESTVLVANDRTGGELSDTCGQRCVRAARLLGLPLLEFRFTSSRTGTVLTHVDPLPSLIEPWAVTMTADLLESLATQSRS